MMIINDFKGEYGFLSNFYACPFEYKGIVYPHAEGAFQAQKCATDEERMKYTRIKNPVIAKRTGKKEPNLPADWDEKALDIMKDILRVKFAMPELKDKLLATGDAELVEGNHWHDNRWGKCTCEKCKNKEAQNLLGKILMEIRDDSMTENEKRLHRCCFTGHRPEKLNLSESQIKAKLRIKISKAISEGYTTFITGMAPGVDILAAEIVLEKKSVISDIKLICALPYPEFCKRKDYNCNLRAKRIIEQADLVKEVCPSYNKSVFQKRNIWMVDRSNLVIAVYNGTAGGTKNTIDYAEKNGVEVRVINCE